MTHNHLLLTILLIASSLSASAALTVSNLRCEYMHDPLGIDIPHPRLSYELLSTGKNSQQSARRIMVATSPELLAGEGIADVWDSGIVRDRETNQIHIQGNTLKPFTFYYWKVRVSDERGRLSAWSNIAVFSTGAMSASDWQAQWIGEDDADLSRKDHPDASPLLRKEININKKVKRAMLYISAIGIYEARINGNKISPQLFAPEWTVYDAHHQYQTVDVTSLLLPGNNAIAATLADGWYSRSGYGRFARKLIAELHIEYVDNTTAVIPTDSSWRFLPYSPILSADFFSGEEYDARMEMHGWDMPGFDDSAWAAPTAYNLAAQPRTARSSYILRAQMNEPVRIIMDIKPVSVTPVADGKYVFDMGQNMVGWCRLSLHNNPGREIRLRYAEVLNPDGTIYTANLRHALQTDIYHPSDKERIEYEPRFTYHGFRYVEVDGLTEAPAADALLGRFIASSSPVAGEMQTSDIRVNKLWENIRYTQWGNLLSVPTDCPQRNERMGWTGDAQTFSQTAIYNLDMAAFYTKWMRDVRDNQSPTGSFPSIAPNRGLEHRDNAPGYADAGHIIPWRLFLNYNDTGILAQQYDGMKRFVGFLRSNNPEHLWLNERGRMFGDWLSGDSIRLDGYPKHGGRVPDDVLATAFYANSVSITAKTARVLGRIADADAFSALADSIRQAFVRNYLSDDGTIQGNTQAGYAIALEYDIIPNHLRAKVAEKMATAVASFDYRISTGILTTAFLMKQLTRYGYAGIAHRLFLSRDCPSWLYMVDHGATTIWERWDSYVEGRTCIAGEPSGYQQAIMNSFNHPALGQVGEWMYSSLLGIRYDEEHPGYRHFIISPQPPKGIDRAKGSYHSINGIISVSWTCRNGRFSLSVTIPANTSATIILPNGTTTNAGSGSYRFVAKVDH
jgi:alpha-L-rhamnosidase